MITSRIPLIISLIFVQMHITAAANDVFVKHVKETEQKKVIRLNTLQKTYEEYQINPNEKFIYIGGGDNINISEMQVFYRNYTASPDDYIGIYGRTGSSFKVKIKPAFIRMLPSFTEAGVDGRINRWIFEKSPPSSWIVKHYGDKYNDYHKQNIEFARKVIKSGICDTVINVDLYSFGGQYLSATCGDRRDVDQMLGDFKKGKPLDPTLKETYLVMPKNKLDALRQNSIEIN